MDIKVLRNFLKIAEYENITRAAAELHIAQPHLTRQLHALEQELGVTLFVREKKRLHITDEGRFLRQQAAHITDLADKTATQLLDMKSGISGTLYLGAIETVGMIYLPVWIEGFRARHPDVKYNLWSGNSTDVMERLAKHLVDIALIREPYDANLYEAIHLLDERWMVLVHPAHRLAIQARSFVNWADLSEEDLMVPTQRIEEISGWFAERGLSCHITSAFSPLANAVAMVEHNLGIAILPDSACHALRGRDLTAIPIEGSPTSGVAVLWHRQMELTSVTKHFIEYLRSVTSPAGVEQGK